MDDLSFFVKQKTGWNLNKTELTRIFNKYSEETNGQFVDYTKLIEDIKSGTLNREDPHFKEQLETQRQASSRQFSDLIIIIKREIIHRMNQLKGENGLKKAYLILGESRNPYLTPKQLKNACQLKLNIFLSDKEIEDIFEKLDTKKQGYLEFKSFVSLLLGNQSEQNENSPEASSLPLNDNRPKSSAKGRKPESSISNYVSDEFKKMVQDYSIANNPSMQKAFDKNGTLNQTFDNNQNAHITFDKKIIGLVEPNRMYCKAYTIDEVENFICQFVIEKSSSTDSMMKTLIKLFSSGESNSNHLVTLDQFKYTLWKRMKMNITEVDLLRVFNKYARNVKLTQNSDFTAMINVLDIYQGMVKGKISNEPLLDNKAFSNSPELRNLIDKNEHLNIFLSAIQQKIYELIDRESRSPHYLIHTSSKMSLKNMKSFFISKLKLDVDNQFTPAVLSEVYNRYNQNGLVDVKRIIVEAMTIPSSRNSNGSSASNPDLELLKTKRPSSSKQTSRPITSSGNRKPLLNSTVASIQALPEALQRKLYSIQEIESLIVQKCYERSKTNHIHSELVKLFRDPTHSTDTEISHGGRYISRAGLKYILQNFDIILHSQEMDLFYTKYKQDNGLVDVHQLIHCLFPASSPDESSFIPKDTIVIKLQNNIAQVLEEITGKRREVNNLNGPSSTRMEVDFMNKISQSQHLNKSVQLTDKEVDQVVSTGSAAFKSLLNSPKSNTEKQPQDLHAMHAMLLAAIKDKSNDQYSEFPSSKPSTSQDINRRPSTSGSPRPGKQLEVEKQINFVQQGNNQQNELHLPVQKVSVSRPKTAPSNSNSKPSTATNQSNEAIPITSFKNELENKVIIKLIVHISVIFIIFKPLGCYYRACCYFFGPCPS